MTEWTYVSSGEFKVAKPLGKRQVRRPRKDWDDETYMNFGQTTWRWEVGEIGSGSCPVVDVSGVNIRVPLPYYLHINM
jgi:hypothetical protein